uniref:Ubiquinone biosynthesis protein n=1 Tax=Blastobotrys adeninivorans TaxID=409370 RepID=A0A060T5H1_BLAAD
MATRVLQTALGKVPQLGFDRALLASVRESGLSDSALALFPKGSFDLVKFHLQTAKQDLEKVQLESAGTGNWHSDSISTLLEHRLRANNRLGEGRLQEALSIMTMPANLVDSLSELHDLSDEVLYLSGERTSDFSWYTKRGAVSSIYAASELFMTQDQSTEFRDTMEFMKDRVKNYDQLEYAGSSVGEWLKFNSMGAFNVLKSLTR